MPYYLPFSVTNAFVLGTHILPLILFSENVDVSAIRSLLSYIFLETTLGISSSTIKSIPIEHASKDLDLKVEVLSRIQDRCLKWLLALLLCWMNKYLRLLCFLA
jgi:hypothetical protein